MVDILSAVSQLYVFFDRRPHSCYNAREALCTPVCTCVCVCLLL